MSLENRQSERQAESLRDKPQVDRVEHANLERPGAQAHPRAGSGWHAYRNLSTWPTART